MRYEKGHKEQTRKKIIEKAARRFRKDGLDAVGLASLMSDAGLTHGGFYNHFKSKEDLIATAVTEALDEAFAVTGRRLERDEGALEKYVSAYLSPQHRDAPDKGCAIAAVAPELARRPEATRQAVSERLDILFARIEKCLPAGLAKAEREARAMAIFSLMVGALQLSRIFPDPPRSERALQSGIKAALSIAHSPAWSDETPGPA